MSWAAEFYSRTGQWWGPAESTPTARDTRRVELLHALCGPGPHRVLELGAGYGTTAVASATAGHDVTAVELTDRVRFLPPLPPDTAGSLRVLQADFYTVELAGRFDAVCYWNGFGVGSDGDQRRLLRRIATEWLHPDGVVVLDVSNPFGWARWHGDEEHRHPDAELGYVHELHERTEFDPVTCTASDTWHDVESTEPAITQWLRCYTPADLRLLLDATGLTLDRLALVGERAPMLDEQQIRARLQGPNAVHEYTARLRPSFRES